MILSGISGFKTITTGPKKLRSDLRIKTKLIGSMFRSSHQMIALRTGFPSDIMGKDLIALMSDRLQCLLLYSEAPTPTIGSARGVKSNFQTTGHEPRRLRKEQDKFPEKLHIIDVDEQRQSFKRGTMHSISGGPETLASSRNETLSESVLGGEMKEPANGETAEREIRVNIRESEGKRAERHAKQLMRSVFVERLREYWQLAEQEKVPQRSQELSGLPSEATGNKKVSIESPLPSFIRGSLPETAGLQVTQKLQSLALRPDMAGPTHSTLHTAYTDSKKGTEIQNVFHIEVKSQGESTSSSNQELSEKIAEILREQALHYGIDIT